MTPSPETCCDRPSVTVSPECSSPNSAPAAAAAAIPAQSPPPEKTVSQPAIAPKVMIPSMPRLSTPARSQTSAPSVPRISGVAIRSTAAHSPAEARISRIAVIAAPGIA